MVQITGKRSWKQSTGVAAWSSGQHVMTSNLRIASRMSSNPGRGKPLFPWARDFTLIAQCPGTDSRVFLYKLKKLSTQSN